MTSCRIALVALFALSTGSCATSPAPSAAPMAVAVAAPVRDGVDVSQVRAAASRVTGVRPAFRACVDAAGGVAVAMQACIQDELQYQQSRLDTALAARRTNSNSNGSLDEIQAHWTAERERLCGADAAGPAEARRIQSGICRLEITAARADVLAR